MNETGRIQTSSLRLTAWLAVVMALTACGSDSQSGKPENALAKAGESSVAAAEQYSSEQIDLLAADQRFAELSVKSGIAAAYEAFIAEDAIQLPDGAEPLAGKQAIMANLNELLVGEEFVLDWAPEMAVVAASNDYGHTWGIYSLETEGADGRIYVAEGKYLTVWRRSAKHGWQVILDISNENGFPLSAGQDFDQLLN